jgi:hypothetical protein
MKWMTEKRNTLRILILAVLAASCFRLAAEENLIGNSSFEEEQNGQVTMWSEESYVKSDEAVRFFIQDKDAHSGTKCLGIANLEPNDSWAVQWVRVKPDAYYRLSGWIRTVDVSEDGRGAAITVSGLTSLTQNVRGEKTKWEYVEVFGKTGLDQTSLPVAARLGFYSNLVKGIAFFDDISLVETNPAIAKKVLDFSQDTYIESGKTSTGTGIAVQFFSFLTSAWNGFPFWMIIAAGAFLVVIIVIIVIILIRSKGSKNKHEKRMYRRKNKKIDACIIRSLPDGQTKKIYLKTHDISLGGVFLSSENLRLFDVEESVHVVLTDADRTVFEGEAKIVWAEALYDSQGSVLKSGYGLKFLNMSDNAIKDFRNRYSLVKA